MIIWTHFYDQAADQCFSNISDLGKGRQMPVHYGSKEHHFQVFHFKYYYGINYYGKYLHRLILKQFKIIFQKNRMRRSWQKNNIDIVKCKWLFSSIMKSYIFADNFVTSRYAASTSCWCCLCPQIVQEKKYFDLLFWWRSC